MSAFEERLGLPPESAWEEEYFLKSGQAAWVVLSGKMASGKDTLAPRLRLPGRRVTLLSFGNILRQKLQEAMALAPEWPTLSPDELSQRLQEVLGYTPEATAAFLAYTSPRVRGEGALDPWERSDFMRTLLQAMGSEWLPNQDYLPALAAREALGLFREKSSVVAAGSRLLPDVEIPRLLGGVTVRLDVSEETQLRRLRARDGLEATPALLEALHHPGELALDDFPHDVRVSNDEDGEEAFEAVVEEVNSKLAALFKMRMLP